MKHFSAKSKHGE